MKRQRWESEAAMMSAFVEWAKAAGFRCVPESCGHDRLKTYCLEQP